MTETMKLQFAEGVEGQSFRSSYGLVAVMLEIAQRLLVEYGCPQRQAIHDAAMDFYTERVVPIDLPGIPNVIEPRFDAMAGDALSSGINAVADIFCGKVEDA